ncbi:Molybdenum ABC transporter, periplasmic molybdenum-binding protein ModA [Candidatus Rhodobacter oscarellae]|uniref:Molybdenum ABC transporter, periplasmic molybdenum-binding protein ModA n=1 Tax=Candidatus Rhodobacter oscarellae TaxID=1675527 RepID=A0A0J9E3Q7_9RHOB|nr:Molybdenum ABC transporter, periplasmic molybdenum-binding protein ModA [Candidatus Rhodobacter lobularis]
MVLLAAAGAARPAMAERVTVAVAANFLTTARDVAAVFSAQTGHEVDLVHGSTGKLFAQIRAGAPFDVFLSADAARPARLREVGEVAEGGIATYAIGRLALVHGERTKPGTLDEILARPSLRFAIADPAVAPYGAAARDVLRAERGATWQSNVVMGESVGQAFTFVATGNVDAGLVALAQARTFEGDIWVLELPDARHAPIQQDAALLKRAAANPAARAFLEFLSAPFARQIISDAGYEVPQ